jgi:hypothetical protein
MAIPDLNNPNKVEAKNKILQHVPTSATGVLNNTTSSNLTYRIISLSVANIDGTNAVDVDAYIVDNVGATGYLAKTISVPADASLLIVEKEHPVYLMENNTLYLGASASGDLSAVISYEEIS